MLFFLVNLIISDPRLIQINARWSKIAQHLPGRTDNEIKNYWRTRVQKQAKQLRCDVNSKQFKDAMRYLWMPRLVERIQAANGGLAGHLAGDPPETMSASCPAAYYDCNAAQQSNPAPAGAAPPYTPESSLSNAVSSDSMPDCYFPAQESEFYSSSCVNNDDFKPSAADHVVFPDAPLISPHGCYYQYQYGQYEGHNQFGVPAPAPETTAGGWLAGDDITGGSSWNDVDDIWFWRQQLLCDDAMPI